jgi:hypothetical protein
MFDRSNGRVGAQPGASYFRAGLGINRSNQNEGHRKRLAGKEACAWQGYHFSRRTRSTASFQTWTAPYLRRIALKTGKRTAQASKAADINPAGVARPVAVTEAQLPSLNVTVPFISSG